MYIYICAYKRHILEIAIVSYTLYIYIYRRPKMRVVVGGCLGVYSACLGSGLLARIPASGARRWMPATAGMPGLATWGFPKIAGPKTDSTMLEIIIRTPLKKGS